MYTSGTTGRAKGTVLTHRNIGAHVMNSMWMAEFAGDAAAKPTTLMTFPLFHVGGLTSFLIPHALFGGKIVLMYKWDVDVALDLIEREGVKSVAGVPTTMTQLLDEAARQGRTLPSLGAVASGATTVPSRLVSRVGARKAAPMIGFGLTESAGAVTSNAGKQYLDRPQSVGRPVSPVMRFRIVDDEGNSLPPGEVGEIWVQGPTIFRAYLDDDEATAAALTDGWFHTGDLGRSDEDGFLYVVDRLKDVIIRGGENIYAAEVEVVLLEHPAVADAAVIGVPDDRLGEQVVAVVVADPGSVDAESLQAFVRDRLAGFKVPSIVEFTSDELPRNAGGKVLKRELQTRFSQQASRGEATTP
jgi:long-chain acyl-CoA synthetase